MFGFITHELKILSRPGYFFMADRFITSFFIDFGGRSPKMELERAYSKDFRAFLGLKLGPIQSFRVLDN